MPYPATSASWQNHPIRKPEQISCAFSFSKDEFRRLKLGLIPEQMEDKWFVFYEAGTLHFCRSWTGYTIYELPLKETDQACIAETFVVERDLDVYRSGTAEAEHANLKHLLEFLLHQKASPSADMDPVQAWATYGRMNLGLPLVFIRKGQQEAILGLLLGLAVGDALGVPVEFQSRERRKQDPVQGMRAFGTHHQPAGTFSDDSSMAFCLAEVLCLPEWTTRDLADLFLQWYRNAYWTAHGTVFDIGIATREALSRIDAGMDPEEAGGRDEYSNGNGSLMRISPLLFACEGKSPEERWLLCKKTSSITHAHVRSVLSCFYLIEFGLRLLQGMNPRQSYDDLQRDLPPFLTTLSLPDAEWGWLKTLLEDDIAAWPEDRINSSGYVVHTLQASVWCLLCGHTYAETVLTAVNLGDDTDTTGAVAGALAGLYYGVDSIPAEWLQVLARRQDIEGLAERLAAAFAEIRH